MAKFYKRNPKNAESFLFRGLTRLLSGPITNYRRQNPRQLKRLQLDKFKFKSASNQPFKKAVSSPLAQIYANSRGNVNRAERYIDFDQMEFCAEIACLEGNTRIMCLEGIFTISELCDKYKNNETFEIWAWDNEKNKYTIGQAHNPRKTGTKEVIKVWFDNGNFLECTPEHRILMIDGTYKEAQQLNNLDAVMPFEFQKREYLRIRKPNGKYKSAHRYIFEDVFERQINSINVHHKNHRKYDNRTDNLELLNALDHARLHGKSTITTEKISKSCRQHWNDLNDDEKKERISGFTRWQSSLEGKKFMSDHASFLNKERWKNDLLYVSKMTQIFSNHARSLWENEDWALWKRNHHSETLKLKFANDPSYKDRIKHIRSENGRFEKSVTNEMVLLEGLNYKTLKEFADGFNFDTKTFKHYNGKVQFLQRRLRSCGFKSWEDYKTNYKYSNHKVEHIEWTGKICDVYDLTVDHFENFCLESGIIVSNSSLDIYADEMTTSSPIQKLLTIKCPNEEIKSVLENLYYNVLNLEFNLFGWCRDTCKYGDKILYLDIDEEHGITNFVGLPLMEIERIEGEDKTNPNYVQFQWNSAGMTFENWQVAHFRILGNDKFAPYGNSILDPVRRIWRQLDLQEQAMMAYRIVRCLHGSSKIWTEDGYKEIKDIKVGDKVYSYDNDKLVLSNVLDWVENGIQQIWEIKSKHRTIRTNFNHPILVKDKDTNIIEYVSVDKLIPNKHMFVMPCVSKKESDLFENIVEVSSTEIFDNVYDIRVDNDNHNFISDGVIVHNSPERRVFYVDVGGINEKDVEQHMEKIMTTMKRNTIVDPDSGQADKRFNPMSIEEDYFIPVIGNTGGTRIESLPGGTYPIRKDSNIPLLDGRTITIEEVAHEYENGKKNYVYSIQDQTHNIVPGVVVWCGKNYTCDKIHRVWLDDGSYVDMAPEHPVILRNGTTKRADELKENDSLMPFYADYSGKVKEKLKGYVRIYNPSANKYEFVHRLIANSIGGKERALLESKETSAAIHHIDYNKNNNRPDNLRWMGFWEHRDFHKHSETYKLIASRNFRKYLLSDAHKENIKNIIADSDSKLHKWIYGQINIDRLIKFNKSQECKEKNSIRNSERWKNKEFRENHSGNNHWLTKKWHNLYKSYSVFDLQEFCKVRNLFYMKDFINNPQSFLKSSEQCRKFLKFHGISSWDEFKKQHLITLKNHKVAKVEIITEIDDVYCMTIVGPNGEQDRHNFAVCSKGIDNVDGKLNGFFVKNTGDIDDVKYLRDKMMSGLKIPHSYIVATEGSMEDKTTLSQKDILFAKTIQRIQRSMVSELEKIGYIHLFVLGYRGKDLISFKLELPNPSKIAELQELEHLKTKFDVAGAATEGYYSRRTIAKKILGMSDEEFLRNTREMFFDAQLAAQLEAIASAGEMAAEGGGDLGDLGGDLGGEEEPPEDETLLAAPGKEPEIPPGKRHDFNSMMPQLRTKGHITAGSKGKVYTPVVSDQRSGGARRRSMRGKYSDEMGRNTFRNVFKGGSEMRTLSKGIFEEYEHNYKQTMTDENNKEDNFIAIEAECSESSIEETQQLTDNASSIKLMIESLEKDDSWKEKIKSSKIGNKPDE